MTDATSVGIVILKGNKVLLVRHEEQAEHITGMYGTPAGRVENGESLIAAAVRELAEETGLKTEEKYLIELPKKYVADITRKNGEIVRFHHTVFLCKNYSGELLSQMK